MQFMLYIDVTLPTHLSDAEKADLRTRENAQSHQFVRDGIMRKIWRVAGRMANYSVWNVDSTEALHEAVQKLPMFPYMKIDIFPILEHPVVTSWKAQNGPLPVFSE